MADAPSPPAASDPTSSDDDVVRLPRPKLTFFQRACRRLLWKYRSWHWRRKLAQFGEGSDLQLPARITGGQAIAIEDSVTVWHDARIEARTNDPEVMIRIGAGTKIQPYVHIGAVRKVTIGRGVLMASRVYITDHDHDFADPFDPVVSNARVRVAPVTIGDYAWLGEGAMVLKGVHVGERSIVGAGSIVTKDVPPLSIVVGSPAKVVQRYDEEAREWVRV